MKRRVYIVEDHPVTREGFRSLISGSPDLEVTGAAGSGPDALSDLGNERPDIVLVDVTIAGSDGLELTKQIRSLYPDLPVLVISAHAEAIYAERAIRAGARGYVMKQEDPEQILDAIRTVLDGSLHLSEPMRERLVGTYLAAPGQSDSAVADLTDRELEVFRHFGHGMSTVDVAEAMMVSPKTVETHRVHIKQKLGLKTTNEFVQRAALWVSRTAP